MQYEIRAMGLGEILDAGFRLLRNHFGLLFGIAICFYLPYGLLMRWLAPDPAKLVQAPLLVLPIVLLALVGALVAFLVSCAVTWAVAECYLGREPSIGGAFRAAGRMFVPVSGTAFLYTLCVILGFLLLVLPGLYLVLAFGLWLQVMVVEDVSGMATLRRSRALTKGHMMRVLGVFTVSGLLVAVLSMAVSLALDLVPVVGFLGQSVVQSLVLPYSSAVLILLYFDIRCRKEAFDLERLASEVEGSQAVAVQQT